MDFKSCRNNFKLRNALDLLENLYRFWTIRTNWPPESFNQGRIEAELNNAIDFLKKENKPVSLMMFDIDFFKKINDNYGHAVGDEVLKAFVKAFHLKLKSTT